MQRHTTRRKCPWQGCSGYFLLDFGVALCPHCRKPVKAVGGVSEEKLKDAYVEALGEKLAFWQNEIETWAAEFPELAAKLCSLI